MSGVTKIRGKVNVVLNGLVREGIIARFRTTFGAEGADKPVVTITVPEGRQPDDVRALVIDALADVAIGLDVVVGED